MNKIKVGAVSLNQTPLDWNGNRDRILTGLKKAEEKGWEVTCFPELCVTGYGCEDMFLSKHVRDLAWAIFTEEIVPEIRSASVIGLPYELAGKIYNTAWLVRDGRIMGGVAKQFLAKEGVHYEARWFSEWEKGKEVRLKIEGLEVPFGDVVFDLGKAKIGIEICEDAWVSERPAFTLIERGASVICNPSASHFALEKHEPRLRTILDPLKGEHVTYVFANLLGNEAGRVIYDGGSFVAFGNEVLETSRRWSFQEVELTDKTKFEIDDEYIEFANAQILALFDYLKKSGLSGYTVSLSGGADSATVAVLVALMVERAAYEIGWEREVADVLTTVYQATRNSSQKTRLAARSLAEELGARHLELEVDDLTRAYVSKVADGLKMVPNWKEHDLSLQNIQARVRSPGAWLIANLLGQILVATSNRSEAAVGYATMDGDTSGGISPLSGIDKPFIRRFLQKMEEKYPSLKLVNQQMPTAELRPNSEKQSDEMDLMPYEVLERIEELAIGSKLGPKSVFRNIQKTFSEYSDTELEAWVKKFYQLWSRNQWKRERYAPAFHVAGRNLDPKTWCRFPILSGGFERELLDLEELDQEVHTENKL